ncbi:hypothetical protein [Candidatus Hodarchaeum mangrovi]
MEESAKQHNDELMKAGYEILERCIEANFPCFIWGGGAIYHYLNGNLDYRKMSDIEFLLPKSADTKMQNILEQMDFIPYSTFNNIQNMYPMPRREFYLPDRKLTIQEIEDIKHGRKNDLKSVKFKKVELFVDGIRMCWKFTLKELPKSYADSRICPPGFQVALKVNPIHPDDFDFKDVQDISRIFNKPALKINKLDTIIPEPKIDDTLECCLGTKTFERISKAKDQFATVAFRNLNSVLESSELTDIGKSKVEELLTVLEVLKKNDKGGFLSGLRREKPVRVDARER